MEIMLIILFFILILIITSRIEIDIQKLEVINKKIKFRIKVKVYTLKSILIFSKKIKKKDIIKLVDFSEKENHFEKERKIIRELPIAIDNFNLKLNYGIKSLYINVYAYAFINAIIPMFLYRYAHDKTKTNYTINTDFRRNYFYIKVSTRISISMLDAIKKS